MRIEINNKTWYDLSDFSSYEEIEGLGAITGTNGIPDCVDIEDDWNELQEFMGLADDEQAVMLAYAEANSVFDWQEAQEAFVGRYASDAEFAEEFCSEVEYEALESLPDYLRGCIDWECVWTHYLRHDCFEQDGYYFRNM